MFKSLPQVYQRFRDRFETKGLILMYHRVAEVSPDPWDLCVTPSRFAEHLEVLKKFGRPLQLQQLARSISSGNLPRRWFVVTFDDGYADNLQSARPLLERFDIPATVFLITGNIGSERELWWDELERILLQPVILPEELQLNINGAFHRWNLAGAAHYSEDDFDRCKSWKANDEIDPTPRHTLYRNLHRLLMSLPEAERRKVQDYLLAWAGMSATGRATHRCLSHAEVTALAQGGLIEIGAHSVTHANLIKLPVEAQREEIMGSKAFLENVTGRTITSFSYPFGSFGAETADIVRGLGFTCACSVSAGIVRRTSDAFQLPRIFVTDTDGEEFSRLLQSSYRGETI